MNKTNELRSMAGRIGTVLWLHAETGKPQQTPMMLMEADLQLHFQPLMGTVPLVEGQMVRVALEDPHTTLRLRFNTRVVGTRGSGYLMRPPADIERDRRNFERIPFRDPTSVKRRQEQGWLPVQPIDLSLGGVAFEAASPYGLNEQIAVQLILLPADPIVVLSSIIRVEGQRVATEFLKLNPTAHRTIAAYVLRQLNVQ